MRALAIVWGIILLPCAGLFTLWGINAMVGSSILMPRSIQMHDAHGTGSAMADLVIGAVCFLIGFFGFYRAFALIRGRRKRRTRRDDG